MQKGVFFQFSGKAIFSSGISSASGVATSGGQQLGTNATNGFRDTLNQKFFFEYNLNSYFK